MAIFGQKWPRLPGFDVIFENILFLRAFSTRNAKMAILAIFDLFDQFWSKSEFLDFDHFWASPKILILQK